LNAATDYVYAFLCLTFFFIICRQIYLSHLWYNSPQTLAMSAAASNIYDPFNAPPSSSQPSMSAQLNEYDTQVKK
jgi:hypothetical protein